MMRPCIRASMLVLPHSSEAYRAPSPDAGRIVPNVARVGISGPARRQSEIVALPQGSRAALS